MVKFPWNTITMSSDAGDLSQDDPNLSRSERKRNREQHRRNEVTNGLDALASMLSTVDPARMKGGRWTSKKETGDGGVAMSRVELLNHALETLERLHKENEARKDIIAELSKGKALSKGAALNDLISQQLKKQRTEAHRSTNASDENAREGNHSFGLSLVDATAAADPNASALIRQHHQQQLSLVLGGMGFHGLPPYGGGLLPVNAINHDVIGGAPRNSGLALLQARLMLGSGTPLAGLDSGVSPHAETPLFAQLQQQQHLALGVAEEEQRRRQMRQGMLAASAMGNTNVYSEYNDERKNGPKDDKRT